MGNMNNKQMKKIFCILFFIIIIAKAFPDEGGKDEKHPRFSFFPIPEIATAELGIDVKWGGGSSPYWKTNLLNMHFVLDDHDSINYYMFDFEITPLIISKNRDIPSYNLSFANLRISYILYKDEFSPFSFDIKPFLEINYLFLKKDVFDFNTLNLQAGFRLGIISIYASKDFLYFETGYAYKNNRHNYFFTIGISPFGGAPPFPSV
jgi:hypothetical protein